MFNTNQGSQFTGLELTRALKDPGVRISMDGKGQYSDNIFVERLWRTVKYEEVCLTAYASVLEAQRGWRLLLDLQRAPAPSGPGYRTPAEVCHGELGAVKGDSIGKEVFTRRGDRTTGRSVGTLGSAYL